MLTKLRPYYSALRPLYAPPIAFIKTILRRRGSKAVLKEMEAIVSKRPLSINMETVTLCNARCVFCAYRKSKRDKTIMTMELFKKICSDYQKLGGGFLNFSPVIADPLVDPLLLDRIRHVKSAHPNFKMTLFTNGIRLPRMKDNDIFELLSSLDMLNVSLGGLERKEYEEMFGVDCFDDVWRGLLRVHDIKKANALPLKVALHFRVANPEKLRSDEKFKQLIELGFDCRDVINSFSDWGGLIKQAELPSGTAITRQTNSGNSPPCLITYSEFTITPDGKVPACGCMDGQLQHIVGDLNNQTIEEIWVGSEYQAFRQSFRTQKLERICENCTIYSPYDAALSDRRLKGYDPTQENFWNRLLG